MARQGHNVVGALGHGEQRRRADAPQPWVVPPRQRLGPAENIARRAAPVLANAKLGLEHHLDLVAVDGAQQVGLQLGGGGAGMGGFATGPDDAPPLLVLGQRQRLRQPVEHRFGVLVGQSPQQREARRQAQGPRAALNRPGDHIGQLLGEKLPALAAALLVGGNQKGAPAPARHQPGAIQLGIGKVH